MCSKKQETKQGLGIDKDQQDQGNAGSQGKLLDNLAENYRLTEVISTVTTDKMEISCADTWRESRQEVE